MKKSFAAAVATLAIASAAAAQDGDRGILRIRVDKDGATWLNETKLDEKAFHDALAAGIKQNTREGDSVSEASLYITCDDETPFAAFKRVFDAGEKLRAYKFRAILNGKFVDCWRPKDHGVFGGDWKPDESTIYRAQLCSTGDAADHLKDWGAHCRKLAAGAAAKRTWIWIKGEPGDPADVDADPKAIPSVAEKMCKAADAPDNRKESHLAVDPDVPMKHVFALLSGLAGGPKSVAEEEKAILAHKRMSIEIYIVCFDAPVGEKK